MTGFNSGAIDPALLSSNGTLNHQSSSVTPLQPASVSSQQPLASALPPHLQTIYPSALSSPAIARPSAVAGPSSGAVPMNGASPAPATTVVNDPFNSNGMSLKEQEMHQKDQELAQFLLKMDDYKPVIPDEVTAHYLQRVGFECTDTRVQRLLGLACQKFVADIAQDAFGYARTRTSQGPGGRQGPLAPIANSANSASSTQPGATIRKDRTRTVLTQEDLAQALGEYGINASRAPYYL